MIIRVASPIGSSNPHEGTQRLIARMHATPGIQCVCVANLRLYLFFTRTLHHVLTKMHVTVIVGVRDNKLMLRVGQGTAHKLRYSTSTQPVNWNQDSRGKQASAPRVVPWKIQSVFL